MRFGGEKGLQDSGLENLGDSRTVVLYNDFAESRHGVYSDVERAGCGHGFEGVEDQVRDDVVDGFTGGGYPEWQDRR